MTDLKTGILLWSQAASWAEMTDAAVRVDRLGYDHLWTWAGREWSYIGLAKCVAPAAT